MTVHLELGAAENCIGICDKFVDDLRQLTNFDRFADQASSHGGFDTARQIGTVYALFVGEDLKALLNGFVDQAKAMAVLFAAAGGLIEAQDEAVAAALGQAAQAPPGLQSLGLMGSIGALTGMLDAAGVEGGPGGYNRVGPEDVTTTPLARMVSGAQALDPEQFSAVQDQVSGVATTLRSAASDLNRNLGNVLGSQWQGHFATEAQTSVRGLTESADQLASTLDRVAEKAGRAQGGFGTTRERIGSEATSIQALEMTTPGFGGSFGPTSVKAAAEMAAAREAAEEQARAVMNTEYSPAVMDANLDDLDFPTAYRVVSTSALGGPSGVDLANIWNVEGVIRPATPAPPSESAIAAATGGAAGGGASGPAGVSGASGVAANIGGGAGPTDAATEQALLASRASGAEGIGTSGAAAGPAGMSGAGAAGGVTGAGGLNASTTAAAAGAPMMNSGTSQSGAGGTASPRSSARSATRRNVRNERGFGSAAGLLGGGGAAAVGAGAAARMGGAGTLSGLGAPAIGAPGLGAPGVGAGGPGVPSAGATSAGGPPGAFSNSSAGGASAARVGGGPMGMMGGARAGSQDDKSEGHRPASYLVNATNASEILGEPVKVSPAKIGARPDAIPPVERKPALVSPGQALFNKLKGR